MSENKIGYRGTVAIGSDHAGFSLKEELRKVLTQEGYVVRDFGTFSTDPVDYPDVAKEVSQAVVQGQFERGILVCGTGIGMSIAANKLKGIRAAACSDQYSAMMARKHNDANILTMGGRVIGIGLAVEIAKTFLDTEFEQHGRHQRRVEKITAMDENRE